MCICQQLALFLSIPYFYPVPRPLSHPSFQNFYHPFISNLLSIHPFSNLLTIHPSSNFFSNPAFRSFSTYPNLFSTPPIFLKIFFYPSPFQPGTILLFIFFIPTMPSTFSTYLFSCLTSIHHLFNLCPSILQQTFVTFILLPYFFPIHPISILFDPF